MPPGAWENGVFVQEAAMIVDPWVWYLSVVLISLVILVDLIVQVKKPHEPTFKESAIQSTMDSCIVTLLYRFPIFFVFSRSKTA